MFSFNKLWKLLIDLGMSKTEFRQKVGLSSTTVAAMGKGTGLTPKVLARICETLHCQPGDIMEYIPGSSTSEFPHETQESGLCPHQLPLPPHE